MADPTTKFETQYNSLVSQLHTKLIFNINLAKGLKIHNAPTPKLYCISKIHKIDDNCDQ